MARLTCYLIALWHGSELAIKISEQFILNRIRDRADHQRMAPSVRLGIHDAHVLVCVELMEKNIEQSLPIASLAQATNISQRQLERLLQQTGMQIIAVAVACGFISAAPFSRAYKSRFGRTPGRIGGPFPTESS